MTDQDGVTRRLPESTRVEGFSDGVFAIALTLLVLDLRAPAANVASNLLHNWPVYVAYLAAFLNIAAIWIHHHDLFTRVRRVDARLICANLLLLLVASLFPWPASAISAAVLSGNQDNEVAAAVLYAAVGFLVPLAWIVLYSYLGRHPQLLAEEGDAAYIRPAIRRALVSVVLYPAAAALAFASPYAALVVFAALPLFFIATLVFPGRTQDAAAGSSPP
ncbi:MAG: TMEM175 family protein [Streptosporangiaceae bacterium]|jgi:uncharacterized membrane protein